MCDELTDDALRAMAATFRQSYAGYIDIDVPALAGDDLEEWRAVVEAFLKVLTHNRPSPDNHPRERC